jgi:hypothetical protein
MATSQIVNFYESTLATILTGATPASTTVATAPTTDGTTQINASVSSPIYLVIDPDNSANREVVSVTVSSGVTFSAVTRDLEGRHSSLPTHQVGTVVRLAVLAEHISDAQTLSTNAQTTANAALPKAGGTMTGTVDFDGQELTQPKLAGYEEKVSDLGALTSGTTACDLEAHNVFEADIQGTVTINLTNVDSALMESATFVFKNTSGSPVVSWQIEGVSKTPLTPGANPYVQTGSGTDIVGVLCYEGNLYLNALNGFA